MVVALQHLILNEKYNEALHHLILNEKYNHPRKYLTSLFFASSDVWDSLTEKVHFAKCLSLTDIYHPLEKT